MHVGVSRESIKKAAKGTSFSWSGWEMYEHEDMVRFFDLYSKYPCIEYLTKLGFTKLIKDRLDRMATYRAINWRGKSLLSVLKIDKHTLQGIKEKNIYVSFLFLSLVQKSKKLEWNLTLEEIKELEHLGIHYITQLEEIFALNSPRKIMNYLNRQKNRFPKHSNCITSSITTLRDYVNDCRMLEMDLTKENVLFPRDLYTAHQNTIKQVKYIEDQELNLKIENRLEDLNNRYYFKRLGFIIRPAISTKELIEEGKALNHCVGGYAERYAKGENILLVIRKAEELDKPYYTVEIRNNEITQIRGKNNRDPSEEVEELIKTFKESRLSKKSRKNKEKIPA